jgi:cell division protein FtsI (penicillin-binding protein 3)
MATKTSPRPAPQRPIREILLIRSWTIFGFMSIIAFIVVWQLVKIQFVEKKQWLAKVAAVQQQTRTIHATRGNIYAADGRSLLATSVPKYRVGLDPQRAKQTYFDQKIDSLCYLLSWTLKDRTPLEYKQLIVDAREGKKLKFISLSNRLINYDERAKILKFPFFREGKMRGGGIFEHLERRVMPFNEMALRTVGKLDRDTQTRGDFGIEASFNSYLAGKNGVGVFQKISGNTWKPVEDGPEIRPEAGFDIVTTIDVNYQDIVESSLYNQVVKMNAKYGTAVVMEIATGEIKAITNLSRRIDSTKNTTMYVEDFNYAVRGGTDPGSTFKLATFVACMEKAAKDGKSFNPNEVIATCTGSVNHRGTDMPCSKSHGTLTIQGVFEHSCNVGTYRILQKYFGLSNLDEFAGYLEKFNLKKTVIGTQLKNETKPTIKNSKSEKVSPTTMPWMGIGYESRMTPLQMLTFYNMIANRGLWVQPLLVKEIRQGNEPIETFKSAKEQTSMCQPQTIEKAWQMMRAVVESEGGTANNIFNKDLCSVAGKTGTSRKRESGYQEGKYYTAFIGFFPADNPKYSCAVVIDEPQGGNLYAADVAAPVFREIADKIFGYDINMHAVVNKKASVENIETHQQAGYAEDYRTVAERFDLPNAPTHAGWVKAVNGNTVSWKKINEKSAELPDLKGLTLRDALPLLENRGYRVRYSGVGKVTDYGLVGDKLVSVSLK